MKKIFFIFIFLILTGLITWFKYQSIVHYTSPQSVVLTLEKGISLKQISFILEKEKVIASRRLFEWMVRFSNKGNQLKAGEYEFVAGLSAQEVMNQLVDGKVLLHTFTIPEGYNLTDIGNLLIAKNLTTADEWRTILGDKEWIHSLGVPADSLEGYLFPDTYSYERGATLRELVKMMTDLFFKKIDSTVINEAKEKGFSLGSWVTLASIIEKETGLARERPQIAAVFLNRLKINMLLQTDPTVIYGIKNFNGNLTRADLERDTPYNTYTRAGLPPGPICSPGFESLKSVLNPAETEALYFVAKGDGSHYFSKTLDQHNQAVNYYQRHIGEMPQ